MSSKILCVIFFLAKFIAVHGVKCKLTEISNQTNSNCDGEYCMKNIATFGSVTEEIFGCISGYPYVEPGCFVEELKSNLVCFCNSSDSCTERDISNTSKILNHTVQCYEGEVENGKILGNKKCTGFFCSLTQKLHGNRKNATLSAGCHFGSSPLTYRPFRGKGCIHANSPDLETEQRNVCFCEDNLCNSPSNFMFSNKTGSVKCVFAHDAINPIHQDNTNLQTCYGDYCFTSITMVHTNNRTVKRGCTSVSNGGLLLKQKYETIIGGVQEIISVCQKHLCNKI